MKKLHQTALRVTTYWLVVITGLWSLAYLCTMRTERGQEWFQVAGMKFVGPAGKDEENSGEASYMFGLIGPLMLASSFAYLAITDIPLPTFATSYFHKAFSKCRRFPETWKRNQFGLGDVNFNYLSFVLVVIPLSVYLIVRMSAIPKDEDLIDATREERRAMKTRWIADYFGFAGTFAMSFFLIPVSRQSVLLCAMGWSPVQAIRLHVWAGYYSAITIFVHGVLYLDYWIEFEEEPLWSLLFPATECWFWASDEQLSRSCRNQFRNWTGVVAGIFFLVLVATSINWFRRRYYRVFYITHVIFGTLTMLASMMHYSGFALLVIPSVVYYLASTAPVLVQGAASYFSGGVEIVKVNAIADSGGCAEIQLALNQKASLALDKEPSLFVKLCVPKISLVWHPFTVFKHPQDPRSVRILFRPVGPFTTKLSEVLKVSPRPPIVIDGFYAGADRAQQALDHDHLTIVTGGVGITPFLSLIPHILHKLSSSPQALKKTKGLTLHWVCREEGLINYVKSNYLNELKDQAARLGKVGEFSFQVHIYHTATAVSGQSTTKVVSDESPVTEPASSANETSLSGSEHLENDGSNSSESSESEDMKLEKHEGIDGTGHLMQEARFKAGKSSKIRQNIAAFFVFSFSAWFGVMLIWKFDLRRDADGFKVHDIWVTSLGSLAALMVSVGFALIVEAAAQLVDRKWKSAVNEPEWSAGTEIITSVKLEEGNADGLKGGAFEGSEDSSDVSISKEAIGVCEMEHHSGRPAPEVMIQQASKAACPGIFMCGPTALTDGVTAEAKKENSLFGRTRYVLYAEPFEM